MSVTLNEIIRDTCIRREQDFAAGFTLEQALAAEKAYSNRRRRHPNGFIGRLTCVESPDGYGVDDIRHQLLIKLNE
ncbi:hypothetical protein MKX03_031042 [Papaver bracteatum]|nr:hypothetical protein MKX03_031042 [Papaver bracteatum]